MAQRAASASGKDKAEKGVEKAEKGAEKAERVVEKGKNEEKCETCGNGFKDKECGIQCEVCEGWFHAKCENINEEGYKVLQMENIHWYCVGCNKGIGRILVTLTKLQKRQEKFEGEIKALHEKNVNYQSKVNSELQKLKDEVESQKLNIKDIKEAINELAETVQQQKNEQKELVSDESLWSNIVKKHVETKIGSVQEEMQEVQKTIVEAKQMMEEEKEKDKRRNNIIIYKLTESKAVGADTRKKDDLDECITLFQQVLEVECGEQDIQSMFRLGKRDEKIIRPLLVAFKKTETKNIVMEMLTKLAEAEDKFRKLSVMHDMTPKEREENRSLVVEAKAREAQETSGEWVYRVRGPPSNMQILKLRKRIQVVNSAAH